jgi:hypothetical protein
VWLPPNDEEALTAAVAEQPVAVRKHYCENLFVLFFSLLLLLLLFA